MTTQKAKHEDDYLFDSTKFHKVFDFVPTGHEEGIRTCAAVHKGETRSGTVTI